MRSVLVCSSDFRAFTASGYDACCEMLCDVEIAELRTPARYAAGPESWVPVLAQLLGASCPDTVDTVRCMTSGPVTQQLPGIDTLIYIGSPESAASDSVVLHYSREPVYIIGYDVLEQVRYEI